MAETSERFKKWAREEVNLNICDQFRKPLISREDAAWAAWQAAERETLERAAQLVDAWLDSHESLATHALTERIRDLGKG